MTVKKDEIRNVKGFVPRAINYASQINDDFGEGISAFYKAIWEEREGGLSIEQKHLMVFAIACSNNNAQSAAKILSRLKKYDVTRVQIEDAMMVASWTGGIQNFTDVYRVVSKEMDRLDF
jgi:alkylhydroperoxidase/carboxymuconolactone decarboxylase family protein YurZ